MHEISISPRPTMELTLNFSDVDSITGLVSVRARATARAYAPTVNGVRNAIVNAVTAVATSDVFTPLIGGANSAFLTALRATSTASAKVPVVTTDVTVNAVVANASGVASVPAPVITSGANVAVNAVNATATSRAIAPTLSGEVVLTGGGPGLSSALARPPVVTVGGATAPAFGATGDYIPGTTDGASVNIPVPAGVVANNIILAFLYVEVGQAVTAPAGFTEAPDSPVIVGDIQPYYFHVYWKRATGADSGTYNFQVAAGLFVAIAFANRYSGCITTGNPLDVTASATQPVPANSPANYPSVSDVTTGPDRLLVWVGSQWVAANSTTVPSGFTANGLMPVISAASKVQSPAGATGAIVGSWDLGGGSSSSAVWLGALKAS